ncbi:MAG: hypothetical protein WDN50_09355 [Bradyrhizobium sp.]
MFGPFYVEGAPHYELGEDVANGAGGIPCLVQGRVRNLRGEGIAAAQIEVWQADSDAITTLNISIRVCIAAAER